MFEGTDLSLAFGGTNGGGWGGMNGGGMSGMSGGGGGGLFETPTPSGMMQTPSGPKLLPTPPPPAPMPDLTIPQSTASHSNMPDSVYDPPEQMYAQQSPTKKYKLPTNNFWDRMGSKKLEVAKLVIFALVILLAISLDRFVTHYLTQYFGQSFLTETQELLVRLAYPLIIILTIWILKAM